MRRETSHGFQDFCWNANIDKTVVWERREGEREGERERERRERERASE